MKSQNKVEILAPVGNYEMLFAAISAGADSVYLGGPAFGARAYADNFTNEDLSKIISLCHFHGVNVYVTVNTLIKEDEMDSALSFVSFLYYHDVDAVIVQDLGLAKMINSRFSDLKMHASTQISANNENTLERLKNIGFSRVTLARELSLKAIEELVEKSNLEIEVFIHGSLCVSYSGKCLMSSSLGVRSGNRGRCAQPCRKRYSVSGDDGVSLSDPGYLLSPKDLKLDKSVLELVDYGVRALKIEGRMKKPDYVYGVVKYYRDILNGIRVSPQYTLDELSNRGFTGGIALGSRGADFYEDRRGSRTGTEIGRIIRSENGHKIIFNADINRGDTISVRVNKKYLMLTMTNNMPKGSQYDISELGSEIKSDLVFRVSNALIRERDYQKEVEQIKIPLQASLFVVSGKHAVLKLESNEICVEVRSEDTVKPAIKIALDTESAKKQIEKLGDTVFYLDRFDFETDDRSFMSTSGLNELRRMATKKLYENMTVRYTRTHTAHETSSSVFKPGRISSDGVVDETSISLIMREPMDTAFEDTRVKRIYLRSLNGLEDIYNNRTEVYLQLPEIMSDKAFNGFKKHILKYREYLSGIMINNLGDLDLVQYLKDRKVVSGIGMNVYNSKSISALKDFGVDECLPSPELSATELVELKLRSQSELELFIYGRLPVMILENCPYRDREVCDLRCGECRHRTQSKLISEEGHQFPMLISGDKTTILSHRPISGLKHLRQLRNAGYNSFAFSIDSREELNKLGCIFEYLIRGLDIPGELIRSSLGNHDLGHFEKPVI